MYSVHKKTQASIKNKKTLQKKNSANITVISLTFLFIVLTSPLAVVANSYTELIKTLSGKLIISIGDSLSFSFHCLSIIILMITNKRFFREMKALFGIKDNNTNNNINNNNINNYPTEFRTTEYRNEIVLTTIRIQNNNTEADCILPDDIEMN